MEIWALLCFWCLAVLAGSQNEVAAGKVNLNRDFYVAGLDEPAPSLCYYYTYTWIATVGAPFNTPLYPSWGEPGYGTILTGMKPWQRSLDANLLTDRVRLPILQESLPMGPASHQLSPGEVQFLRPRFQPLPQPSWPRVPPVPVRSLSQKEERSPSI